MSAWLLHITHDQHHIFITFPAQHSVSTIARYGDSLLTFLMNTFSFWHDFCEKDGLASMCSHQSHIFLLSPCRHLTKDLFFCVKELKFSYIFFKSNYWQDYIVKVWQTGRLVMQLWAATCHKWYRWCMHTAVLFVITKERL